MWLAVTGGMIFIIYLSLEEPNQIVGDSVFGFYLTKDAFLPAEFIPAFLAGVLSIFYLVYLFKPFNFPKILTLLFITMLGFIPMLIVQNMTLDLSYFVASLAYMASGGIYLLIAVIVLIFKDD